jgi:outer membrane lipoprotein
VRYARVFAFLLLLGGCATAFPEDALRGVDRSVTVADLLGDPDAYVGRRVMIGGDILATRPKPGSTEIELLSKTLDADDRPRHGDSSNGRALVTTTAFLDPAVFAEHRRVTVIGTVTGTEERKIGELPYRYPVIAATDVKLWPRETVMPPYPPPWPYTYPWPYPGWRYRGWAPYGWGPYW